MIEYLFLGDFWLYLMHKSCYQACDQLETKKKENLTTPQITPTALIKYIYLYISTLKDISNTVRIHTIVL